MHVNTGTQNALNSTNLRVKFIRDEISEHSFRQAPCYNSTLK